MAGYLAKRIAYMLFTIWLLSIVVFIVIQLPPGDFLTSYLAAIQAQGTAVDSTMADNLRQVYGLDRSLPEQYFFWFSRFIQGDMGRSFQWGFRPVTDLLADRLAYTVLLSSMTLLLTYLIAIPIGIHVATHQYGLSDYLFSVVGFIGMATPNFMLALILMYIFFRYFGMSVGGLYSPQYASAPWSMGKAWDLMTHLWIPVLIIGLSGTAGLIRVMRGCLLDELSKQYVITARAKGVPEGTLLFRYPVRVALNPIISTVGWQLPRIISGETITAIVLTLPTTGPLLYQALISQDMFMAGSIVMLLGILTVIGTLISDILLVIVDPRIRFEKRGG
jgi:peptide/nickel transport system permease protein